MWHVLRTEKSTYGLLVGNLKEIINLEDLNVDETIILKYVNLQEMGWGRGLDLSGSG
jgi:hypothetical protein